MGLRKQKFGKQIKYFLIMFNQFEYQVTLKEGIQSFTEECIFFLC